METLPMYGRRRPSCVLALLGLLLITSIPASCQGTAANRVALWTYGKRHLGQAAKLCAGHMARIG